MKKKYDTFLPLCLCQHVIHRFFIFFMLFFCSQFASGTITIHSISTAPSSCGNNGTATILAGSSKSDPALFYEIIAGPVTAPVQNSSTFSSLFPGDYTVRVYDIDFMSKDAHFSITGNYELPVLNPIAINPICTGFSDGRIIGNASPSKGKKPFTWQIIAPYTTAPQASDTFNNLYSGTYVIRMTDACGNFQTRTVILVGGGTGLSHWYDGNPTVYKTGCDTVIVTQMLRLFKEKANIPLKLTLRTNTGTITKQVYAFPLDTINYTPGFYAVSDTVPGITYGSYLSVCLTDTCGISICGTNAVVSPFEFYLEYKTGASCDNKMSARVLLKNPPVFPGYMYTTYRRPATMTLRDVATNTIVDSMTCSADYCSFEVKEQVSGRNYLLRIEDVCGQVFQKNITWPSPAPPSVDTYPGVGCMDSTGVEYFNIYNFKSDIKLEILSGPAKVSSTKPGYAFSDNISYPKTFDVPSRNGFALKNLPAGTYQYRISDLCNNVVNGYFTVDPLSLADFNYSYTVRKGCLGDNILYFNPVSSNTAGVYIRNSATGDLLYGRNGMITQDSLTSLPPGSYVLEIYYGYSFAGGAVYDAALTDGSADCWAIHDTITIPPYNNNTFQSATTISCNGNIYMELNVDSTRGVPPYQYEITSGPQTFPLQNSNVFSIGSYGNYVIRIQDACGNSNIRQISADSAKFPPLIRKGATCTGKRLVLKGISSPFFTYTWTRPDGSVLKGDSLVIPVLSSADTGVYILSKTVRINSCTETFRSTYHVRLNSVYEQTIPFCPGNKVKVGSKVYDAPGIYRDTLTNSGGCDSLVFTSLIRLPQKTDTHRVSICKGSRITVGNNTYLQTGIYKDSVQNSAGCYDITVTDLKVTGSRDTITRSVCRGNSIHIGNNTYNTSGTYTDTLVSAAGCDSIIVLRLTVTPYLGHSISHTLCEGESYRMGSHYYYKSGIYKDTLATAACDSIVTLDLTVLPAVKNSIVRNICQGQGFSHGKHTYHEAGIYKDTLISHSGCDSIVTLNLIVSPYKRHTLTRTICMNESFQVGNHLYGQSGIYTDTLSTASCDSIVTLYLTVISAPALSSNYVHCFEDGPLSIASSGTNLFLWPGRTDTTAVISIEREGTYPVMLLTTTGCTGTGQITAEAGCDPKIFVPDAFTPNGDGLHDDLEIFGKHFKNFEIKIFNRWGEIIFISRDRNIRWDGMYRDELMPVGTYPWVITYEGTSDRSHREHTLKGSVTLIR